MTQQVAKPTIKRITHEGENIVIATFIIKSGGSFGSQDAKEFFSENPEVSWISGYLSDDDTHPYMTFRRYDFISAA